MKEAVIQSDGSIIGTLEQYYVRVVSTLDSRTGQSNYTYYYYYNNITIINSDKLNFYLLF